MSIENKINDIQNKMNHIEDQIKSIDNQLDKLLNLLEKDIQPNCNKMSKHIDFIEYVYNYLKNPMYFLSNKMNYLNYSK